MPSQHPELNEADWLRREYIEFGRTRREIALQLGCAPSTVGDALRRFGIRKRPVERPVGSVPSNWLRRVYVDSERSLTDIAAEVGVAPPTIRRALVEAEIPIRRERRPPELDDRDWCEERQHESPKELARMLRCTSATVRRAMQRHGLRPLKAADDLPYPELGDPLWLAARHHGDRLTHGEIAAAVGCSRSAVTQAMQRLGVESRPPGRIRHRQLHDPAWLEAQVRSGRTMTDIAREVNCDWKSVREALERNGISY